MSDGKIFGHDWEDIQRAQQGGSLAKRIVETPRALATDADRALLTLHGENELRAMQLYGVIDRLQASGLIKL